MTADVALDGSLIHDLPELLEPLMRLQLNTSAPDPIGFAQVSGFYGPGTWAAWFLTLCGSWFGLSRGADRFDANTLLYLAGLNWAAVDLLRHLHNLDSSRQAKDSSWMNEAASVGAAFTVVWWGLCHALAQLALCFKPVYRASDIKEMHRGITLIVGSSLAAAALTSSAWMLDAWNDGNEVSSQIPALYWNGMKVTDNHISKGRHDINQGHDLALYFSAMFGFWILAVYLFLASRIIWLMAVPYEQRATITAALRVPWEWLRRRVPGCYLCLVVVVIYIIFVIILAVEHAPAFWYFLPIYPPLLALAVVFMPMIFVHRAGGLSVFYIFSAYFHLTSSPSQSCFFMPCAPQPISDTDQSFALFLGLFSLFIIEIGVPYLHRVRKERRDMRLFKQQVARRIEMVSPAGASSSTPQNTFANSSGPSEEVQEPETSSTDIQPLRGVNSGIAAEEGTAGLEWRSRRTNSRLDCAGR